MKQMIITYCGTIFKVKYRVIVDLTLLLKLNIRQARLIAVCRSQYWNIDVQRFTQKLYFIAGQLLSTQLFLQKFVVAMVTT